MDGWMSRVVSGVPPHSPLHPAHSAPCPSLCPVSSEPLFTECRVSLCPHLHPAQGDPICPFHPAHGDPTSSSFSPGNPHVPLLLLGSRSSRHSPGYGAAPWPPAAAPGVPRATRPAPPGPARPAPAAPAPTAPRPRRDTPAPPRPALPQSSQCPAGPWPGSPPHTELTLNGGDGQTLPAPRHPFLGREAPPATCPQAGDTPAQSRDSRVSPRSQAAACAGPQERTGSMAAGPDRNGGGRGSHLRRARLPPAPAAAAPLALPGAAQRPACPGRARSGPWGEAPVSHSPDGDTRPLEPPGSDTAVTPGRQRGLRPGSTCDTSGTPPDVLGVQS